MELYITGPDTPDPDWLPGKSWWRNSSRTFKIRVTIAARLPAAQGQPSSRSKLSGHMVQYYCYITGLNSLLLLFLSVGRPLKTPPALTGWGPVRSCGSEEQLLRQHQELLPRRLRLCFWSDFGFLFPGHLPDDVWWLWTSAASLVFLFFLQMMWLCSRVPEKVPDSPRTPPPPKPGLTAGWWIVTVNLFIFSLTWEKTPSDTNFTGRYLILCP